MKKAILVVSFGTSHMDTLEKTILPIENDIAAAFPDRIFYRAFSSGMIVRKLKRSGQAEIDTVEEALERITSEGVRDLIVQPSHIINGEEFDLLTRTVEKYAGRFEMCSLGTPLLTSDGDFAEFSEVLMREMPEKKADRLILFMGHGSPRFDNSAYGRLEEKLRSAGRDDVMIGTVEGTPKIGEILVRLEKLAGIREVFCQPLLIVAGDHAKNDMSGDEPDSWKMRLQAKGYEVECVLKGLGEYAGVRELFVRHAERAS